MAMLRMIENEFIEGINPFVVPVKIEISKFECSYLGIAPRQTVGSSPIPSKKGGANLRSSIIYKPKFV